MFKNPSLMTRIAIGKSIGLLVGLCIFVFTSYLWPESSWMLRWGLLLWYVTFGALIGVFGIFTYHPVLRLPTPWWVRAPLLGAWLNFVLSFFAYDDMQEVMIVMFGVNGPLSSPFWFALEGALVGLLIGYLATRFGGEGREALDTVA